jgi:hypothetical protein
MAFKNPSPRQDLKPRTLGQMVSTITITPPRRHHYYKQSTIYFSVMIFLLALYSFKQLIPFTGNMSKLQKLT